MKKIRTQLVVPDLDAGTATIDATELAAGSVDTSELAADAVTGAKIEDDAVDSEHIAAGAVDTEHIAANNVTGAKIPETAVGEIEQVAVALDHADSSPAELLAADASNDRIVWVRAVATEAAAGEPDVDVGSDTTDTNAIVDDVGAGAWAVGDRFEGMCVLPAGEALVATIAAAGTAGAFNCYITALTPLVQTAQVANDAITNAKLDGAQAKHLIFEYDFADLGGAQGAITLTDTADAAQTIPDNALVTRAYLEAITSPTSGGSATIMLGITGDTDAFIAATAYDNAVYVAEALTELTAAIPVKTSAAVSVIATVATADLTAGKFRIHVEYIEGA
jgi:hypothetical protein